MTPQAARMQARATAEKANAASDKVVSLLILSLAPALFWTALVGLGGSAIGHQPDAFTLAAVGAAIAAFLAVVAKALLRKIS
jgi:hypothetical protein